MTMQIPKTLKLVYVEWDDADATAHWMDTRELEEYVRAYAPVRHAGFILQETDELLIMAGQWMQADQYGESRYGHVMRIPKPWIRKRIVLMTVGEDGTIKRKP